MATKYHKINWQARDSQVAASSLAVETYVGARPVSAIAPYLECFTLQPCVAIRFTFGNLFV